MEDQRGDRRTSHSSFGRDEDRWLQAKQQTSQEQIEAIDERVAAHEQHDEDQGERHTLVECRPHSIAQEQQADEQQDEAQEPGEPLVCVLRVMGIAHHPDPPIDQADRDHRDEDKHASCGIQETEQAQCYTDQTTQIGEEGATGCASASCEHLKSTIENQVDTQDGYEDVERKKQEESEEEGDPPSEKLSPPQSRMIGLDVNPFV